MHPTLRVCGRSAWKGPYFVEFPGLSEAIEKNIVTQTQARNCTILPSFIGARFGVHNGKTYVPVTITQDMVGHKLGEFSPTRKRFTFKQTRNA